MKKEKQLKKMGKLLAPVLEWLEDGAKGLKLDGGGKVGFNMDSWYVDDEAENHKGKSVDVSLCIGGAVAFFAARKGKPIIYKTWYDTNVQVVGDESYFIEEYFEKKFPMFSEQNEGTIFRPCGFGNWQKIKPKQAARVIRHFLKTGETDWSKRNK